MDRAERNPIENCSWWSFLTFSWLTPTLDQGTRVPLRAAPPLPEADNSVTQGTSYVQSMGSSDAVLRTLVWEYRWALSILQVCAVIQHCIGLASPLILKEILVFQELNNKKDQPGGAVDNSGAVTAGLFAIQLFILVEAVRIVFGSQVGFLRQRVHIRMSAALSNLVLHRSMHRWGSSETAAQDSSTAQASKNGSGGADGAIYNVLASDVGVHISAISAVTGAWMWPFSITTACLLLYREIGPAAYPGVVAMVILQLVYLVLESANGMLRSSYMESKDERMSRLSESFVHVRSLRVNNWREPMAAHVQDSRDTEMKYLAAKEYMTSVQGGLGYIHATIVTLVVFYYFLQTPGQSFRASLVLPVIGLLAQVNGPIGSIPNWVRTYIEYCNATLRMKDYIRTGGEDREPSAPAEGAPIVSVNAEFKRPSSASDRDVESLLSDFSLKASLEIHAGEVVMLTGPTSSGKTMLLQALLGEVPRKQGVVRAPRTTERQNMLEPETIEAHGLHVGVDPIRYPDASVTFCPQTPWVFSGTVRENITFGMRFDEDLYDRVVAACALTHDISTFPEGDDTEIGASTISGGQKVRIALSRACYRALLGADRPTLVMLDDPLRSVDGRVGRHIAAALVGEGGLLRRPNLSVLWATATVPHGVEAGARVLCMANGTIVEEHLLQASDIADDSSSGGDDGPSGGVPSALLIPRTFNPQDDSLPLEKKKKKKVQEPRDQLAPFTEKSKFEAALGKLETGKKIKLFVEENAESGTVAWDTYMRYSGLVGHGAMSVILVSIGGIMVSQQCTDLFLAYWTDEHKEANFLHPWLTEPIGPMDPIISSGATDNRSMYKMFLYLCIVFAMFNFTGFLLEVWGGLRAARTTFTLALHGCLRRPVLWWDTNPTGRVINRFQADQNCVDMTITRIVGVISGAVYYFIGRAFFLAIVNPISVIVLIPTMGLMEWYAARLFRPNIRESQRMLLMAHSPFYNNIVENLRGQVTVRAFGAQAPAVLQLLVSFSHVQQVTFFQQSLYAWLGFRLSVISFVLSITSTCYPVMQYYGLAPVQSAGLIGFAIMYSQQLEGILSQLIHNFSEMETQLVSLERLAELAEAPADRVSPLPGVGKDLVVKNLFVRYRAELSHALQGVSFTIQSEEKVAIVGRTGSGKSSLMLCILGQIPHEGDVMLGGVRVSGHNVANRIGLVPQEAVLFRGTLRFNLDPTGKYKDEQLWAALRAAGLSARVEEMRSEGAAGLDVRVGEGDGLSGAEAQQLGLARVLLRKLDVVLLDEVTSCLSPAAAERLLSLMWQALEKKTVLMVTHQLELAQKCSRSIVLDTGKIVHDSPIMA